jgi:chaperonin GroES
MSANVGQVWLSDVEANTPRPDSTQEEPMNLTPLGDRVIVKAVEQEEVSAGGIVLPDTVKEKPQRGRVLAVGQGRYEDGKRVPLEVVAGDEVVYSKYGGSEVKVEGEDVLILAEHDILAKLAAPAKTRATPATRRVGRAAK